MTEIKAVAFRTAVSGYNKRDVNDYIAHLGENLAGCMKEREDLETQLTELRSRLDEALAANAALVSAADAQKVSGNDELERANAVIAAQNEALTKLRAENEALLEASQTASAKLAESQVKLEAYDEMASKLADYERMSSKMGKLYIEAASGAEKIRTDAESYAAKRKEDTENECDKMREDANARLKRMSEKSFEYLNRIITDAAAEITATAEKLRVRVSEVSLASINEPSDPAAASSANTSVSDFGDELSKMLANVIGEEYKK